MIRPTGNANHERAVQVWGSKLGSKVTASQGKRGTPYASAECREVLSGLRESDYRTKSTARRVQNRRSHLRMTIRGTLAKSIQSLCGETMIVQIRQAMLITAGPRLSTPQYKARDDSEASRAECPGGTCCASSERLAVAVPETMAGPSAAELGRATLLRNTPRKKGCRLLPAAAQVMPRLKI